VMLSDSDIVRYIQTGSLIIDPYDPGLLQPASLDVRLGNQFYIPRSRETVSGPEVFWLPRGTVVLGHTVETVKIPNNLAVRVEGKSTWGRRGLMVHLTAGFIDPGFTGQITLELLNVGTDMFLAPGDPIAQLSFHLLSSPARRPYGSPGLGSHYQGQMGPVPPAVN
jgi:dCTP deaminase